MSRRMRLAVGFALVAAVVAPTSAKAATTCQGQSVTVDLNAGGQPTLGNDVILGTSGPDTILAKAGNDLICAGGGADDVRGGGGEDRLYGEGGSDDLAGGSDEDVVDGGPGPDTLTPGADGDQITGGDGTDTLDYSDATAGISIDLAIVDTGQLTGGSGTDALRDLIENFSGSPFGDHARGLNDFAKPNKLVGRGGADLLVGRNGADTLIGGGGNDSLLPGVDGGTFKGGAGTDFLNFQDAGNPIDLDLSLRTPQFVVGAGSHVLLDRFEQLRGGTNDDLLKGTDHGEFISGHLGDDRVKGRGGNDVLEGLDGADTLGGGPGSDICNAGGNPGDTETSCEE